MEVKVLIIDNFDSFTYNLVQIVKESKGCTFNVVQTDQLSFETPAGYDGIIISPGPGVPSETPLLKKIIRHYENGKSILGICLGHQAITEAYGGQLNNLRMVFHGVKQKIVVTEPSDYLFRNVPETFYGGLYHSWEAERLSFPAVLKITAISEHQIIMAFSHKQFDVRGVQFHPESYMTEHGKLIINNWLEHLRLKQMQFIL